MRGGYHFVLVKLDVECTKEAEAFLHDTEDLNHAFDDEVSPAGQYVAECLKALGYSRVEGFNIVNQAATPVAKRSLAADGDSMLLK